MNKPSSQNRIYHASECIAFRKTSAPYGGLSNMAPGYPLVVNGIHIRTAEALYQACRFPNHKEIQKEIIFEQSPMTAKMRGKKYISETRDDWDNVRFKIMRWCLEVKLFQNWNKFSLLLRSTAGKNIVESTPIDKIWGAVLKDDTYEGINGLGRLLMEVREKYVLNNELVSEIKPPDIPKLLLYGDQIDPIKVRIE